MVRPVMEEPFRPVEDRPCHLVPWALLCWEEACRSKCDREQPRHLMSLASQAVRHRLATPWEAWAAGGGPPAPPAAGPRGGRPPPAGGPAGGAPPIAPPPIGSAPAPPIGSCSKNMNCLNLMLLFSGLKSKKSVVFTSLLK